MRSSAVPPNTIAPRRPLPTGSASFHFSAGLSYQSFRSDAEASDVKKRINASVFMTHPLTKKRQPHGHLAGTAIVPGVVGNEDEVKLLRLARRQVAIQLPGPFAGRD